MRGAWCRVSVRDGGDDQGILGNRADPVYRFSIAGLRGNPFVRLEGTLAPERLSALRHRYHREHRLVDPDQGQSTVGPRGRALAVQPGDHVLRLARRAGSGRLRRGHGDGLRFLDGHPADREPYQATAPRPAALQRQGRAASRGLQDRREQRRRTDPEATAVPCFMARCCRQLPSVISGIG